MKNTLKFIGSFICSTLLIVLSIMLVLSATWYLLPASQTTQLGILLSKHMTDQEIFILTIVTSALFIICFILTKVLNIIKSSKINNFCLHVLTWLLAIILVVAACYTFFTAATLKTKAFELTAVRKIGLGAGMIAMLLYCLLHKKIGKLVDRKLQAYDTAKELNANGRSSVVWVNILKVLDFIFPEFILLIMLCFSFSFEISLYFIFIICAFIIPIIGNMICDKRVRKEAVRKEKEKTEAQIQATAEAVAEMINSGDNVND